MSDTPAASSQLVLWPNSRIEQVIATMPVTYASMWRVVLHEMRDEYQAEIAKDKARIAELETTARLLRQRIMAMDAEMLAMEEQEDDNE